MELTSRTFSARPTGLLEGTWAYLSGEGVVQGAPPEVIISPERDRYDCWAIHGSRGEVTIRLSRKIEISAVTIEHVPEYLRPMFDASTSPKDLEFWASSENSSRCMCPSFMCPLPAYRSTIALPAVPRLTSVELGSERYYKLLRVQLTSPQPGMVRFSIPDDVLRHHIVSQSIMIKILSNRGSAGQTILYRVQVHGVHLFDLNLGSHAESITDGGVVSTMDSMK